MNKTSADIVSLLSLSWKDWIVTLDEESKVVALLESDTSVGTTIRELEAQGFLEALVERVQFLPHRYALIQLLGGRLYRSEANLVEPHVNKLRRFGDELLMQGFVGAGPWPYIFNVSHDLQSNLRLLGLTSPAMSFATAPGLVSNIPTDPFTGVGASGVDPTTLEIPLTDQAFLASKHRATTARYSNPIPGNLLAYLRGLSPQHRLDQARLLLHQPIVNSLVPLSYPGPLPTRADLIRAAAKHQRLEPQLLAAFILAEQRDQSRNEDAAEFSGAVSVLQRDTSIGLGQVLISTAQRQDLFSDLLSAGLRTSLTHDQVARLLTCDDFNIFATAKYIRIVADQAAKINIATLPRTVAQFPNISLPNFAQHSRAWPDDNIRALGSEYTSRAWDDNLSPGWGPFVFEAYQHVSNAGVF